MVPLVESAWIAAGAAAVGVIGTATVGIVGFFTSRSTNRETIAAAKVTTDESIAAAREASKAAIEAAHADVQRTLDTTRVGQIADLYSRAIEQLGSGKLDVRIGGIYALERVARDSAADHPTVMEVLSAFIREHSREQWPLPDAADLPAPERATRPDVQAALTVIGRRDATRDRRPIDLHEANLTRATLTEANLSGVKLTGANLNRADLIRADLSDADLFEANLSGARPIRANLTGANLAKADLTTANLARADLIRANLYSANLTRANLATANLTNARLFGAKLIRTRLLRANLTAVELTPPPSSDSTEADLTDADLTDALWSQGSQVPEGWARDPASGKLHRQPEH
jgi:hypothetical protein